MHRFSINCKADNVVTVLATVEGRNTAIERFRELGVCKVYIETYRTGIFVEEELLKTIRDEFGGAGFETASCVVPTAMSDFICPSWSSMTCFSDPSSHRFLQRVVERSARLFDTVIFDDFLFTQCDCERCTEAKGSRSWEEYRIGLMDRVIRDYVIAPARAVNPEVKLIIKYPCWYDRYRCAGYDTPRESALFDQCWIGTETRDPDNLHAGRCPQMRAFWIQNYMNLSGNCGGGWYDVLACSPETFVEQARNTILGGARESLLHCYDYLYLGADSVAKDGGAMALPKDDRAARAFIHERSGLLRLAEAVDNMTLQGVQLVKNPLADQDTEGAAHGFLAMLGFPVKAAGSLNEIGPAFFTAHASTFENIVPYMEALRQAGVPFAATSGFAEAMGERMPADVPVIPFGDGWSLRELPDLDELRNHLLGPYGLKFHAPFGVSLLLYKNENSRLIVIQNFNDTTADVELETPGEMEKFLSLPDDSAATGTRRIHLEPRSLLALKSCGNR